MSAYTLELEGSDVPRVYELITDHIARLEARAVVLRGRRTTHARNSLRNVESELAEFEAMRTRVAPVVQRRYADLVDRLSTREGTR